MTRPGSPPSRGRHAAPEDDARPAGRHAADEVAGPPPSRRRHAAPEITGQPDAPLGRRRRHGAPEDVPPAGDQYVNGEPYRGPANGEPYRGGAEGVNGFPYQRPEPLNGYRLDEPPPPAVNGYHLDEPVPPVTGFPYTAAPRAFPLNGHGVDAAERDAAAWPVNGHTTVNGVDGQAPVNGRAPAPPGWQREPPGWQREPPAYPAAPGRQQPAPAVVPLPPAADDEPTELLGPYVPSGSPTALPAALPAGPPAAYRADVPAGGPAALPAGPPAAYRADVPTGRPTGYRADVPTGQPTAYPADVPTGRPTGYRADVPPGQPRAYPADVPIGRPTGYRADVPPGQPTAYPADVPIGRPTGYRADVPPGQPTAYRADVPTGRPTGWPTAYQTDVPTGQPALDRTEKPPLDGAEKPAPEHGRVKPPHPPRAVVRRRRARRRALEWPVLIVFALVSAYLIRAYVVQTFYIPSGSMHETLLEGDRVLVNKVGYHLHEVHRGDVVVFRRPPDFAVDEDDLIKRVIGLPGQTVEGHDGKVYVDGAPLTEPYVEPACRGTRDFAQVTVPPGKLWVMGDNRCNSSDSRVFGPIDEHLVVGRAFVLAWPVKRLSWL